ncbi:spherulation-specific family 4 protein [Streptomyces sp. NPDC006704]|uniref:spherulation-specific family 4 protein n=1 Tax=Streptomyces sp. NPDC006704 TaxID=3364760 RepID=UPI0036BD6120
MSKLLVPYYEHPAERPDAWDALIAAAPSLYGVVLNPADGPGSSPDAAFAAVAARLRSAGVRVLGYVDTAYGRRPPQDVIREAARHHDWYGTHGLFLDQAATSALHLPYYADLRTALAATHDTYVTLVLNHGAVPEPGYARIADLLVTFEGPWSAYRPNLAAGPDTCHLVYDAPPGALSRAPVHCLVPGGLPHPWGTLPHHLEPAM